MTKRATTKTTVSRLCPGCEAEAPLEFEDASGRAWHRACALRALAEGYRTPLSPVEASAGVEFELVAGERFRAPAPFHLREVAFDGDAEVDGVWIGADTVAYAPGTTIRGRDLPGGRLVVDAGVPRGVEVNAHFVGVGRVRLVGERRPGVVGGLGRVTFVIGLRAEDVPAREARVATLVSPAPFRGARLACDDWEGWAVEGVRAGLDPGLAHVGPVLLTAPVMELPTYELNAGEPSTYRLRNLADRPRTFDGRVYGKFVGQ